MTFEKFEMNVLETRVGEISGTVVYFAADIMSSNIQEKVNQKLTQSPIDFGRLVEGLVLMNNAVKVSEGVFEFTSNFTYQPPTLTTTKLSV